MFFKSFSVFDIALLESVGEKIDVSQSALLSLMPSANIHN